MPFELELPQMEATNILAYTEKSVFRLETINSMLLYVSYIKSLKACLQQYIT